MWNLYNSFEFDQFRTQTHLADGLVRVQTKFTVRLDHRSSGHGTGGHSFWQIWIRGCWFEWSVQHGHLEINWWRCKEFVFVILMVPMLKSDKFQANLFNSEGLGSSFVFSGGKSRVLKPYFYWVIGHNQLSFWSLKIKKLKFLFNRDEVSRQHLMITVDPAFQTILYQVRNELKFAFVAMNPFKSLDSNWLLGWHQVHQDWIKDS